MRQLADEQAALRRVATLVAGGAQPTEDRLADFHRAGRDGGLRDRAEALGGSIEVSGPPGEGTLVLPQLPLRLR